MELKQLEKICKALGDVTRLGILEQMSQGGGAIQCAAIMEFTRLAQPSVSHHIKTLIEAGLISPEKEGRSYSYQLNRPLMAQFGAAINDLASVKKATSQPQTTLIEK